MAQIGFWIHLDQLSSSYFVIIIVLLLFVAAGVLLRIGLIGWCVGIFANLMQLSIRNGFGVWRQLFAWAPWPLFLSIMIGWLVLGCLAVRSLPALTVICALIPLFMGLTACLAYMMIDLERFAVARGSKSVHNPLEGQELAVNLVRYGQAVGVPLLVSATVGMVGGFALLNFGLYETIGRKWYAIANGQAEPTYVDFVANALIVLLKIVDLLDFAKASRLLEVAYVHQAAWPSSALMVMFRMFFTLVLLQQVFASVRQGQVLSATISDLWNPHEPIHRRAQHAFPQHGPGAVGPLLISLGNVTSLTKEQRERIPSMLAAIGPTAIPSLVRHLYDGPDHVRAIVAASLGHLRVRETIQLLVVLSDDPSEIVRKSLVESLGIIASPVSSTTDQEQAYPQLVDWRWSVMRWKTKLNPLSPVEAVALAVKTLLNALGDDSLAVRGHAVRALGQIGSPASSSSSGLISMLKDEDEMVRWEAIQAVAKVGGAVAQIVDALIDLLQDASPLLRSAAARELGSFGEAAARAFPSLVPLLQDREVSVRESVAEAIGLIGHLDDQAIQALVLGFGSRDTVIRAQTAEALGTIGVSASETASALVKALGDKNDTVRAKVVQALGKIGEDVADVALPGLIRALQDQDNVVSSLAAEALGQMGESADAAIPSLVRSLHHINPEVRASAAESLGRLGVDVAGAPAALQVASRDEDADVRSQAIHALGIIQEPTITIKQAVYVALEDSDAEVRTAAVIALSRWGELDEAPLAIFLTLLGDANENVRMNATKVLPAVTRPTPAVIESLCVRLNDDTELVQSLAAHALGELGPAALAAEAALLHAVQTGGITVREEAIKALLLISPSLSSVAIDESEEEQKAQKAIDELQENEGQTQPSPGNELTNIDPAIITIVIDS